ncbi:putative cytochrome P450 [Daldinia decipiens]|uniref:putative cytochrome P450 n=1 Tax=Daldinia decipiens TaxID=326647 RepID=UPI0020C3910D|nr:putative cytochrome P450 [Daldinia decipiens]KAI1654489.1 putative cytochrome P450 [Daldinia decipiens]
MHIWSLSSIAGTCSTVLALFLLAIPFVSFKIWQRSQNKSKQPPRLNETIPFVSNAWQFMTNKRAFISRVRVSLETSPIVQCRIGPLNLHLVTGGSNISAIFRSSFTSDPWILRILQHSAGYSPTDLAKFRQDESGSANLPRSGSTRFFSPEKRIWYALHRTYNDGLVGAHPVDAFSASFQSSFSQKLAMFLPGEWVEVRVFDFLKRHMMTAATNSVLGPRIIEVNPGFEDAFWQYEKAVETLAFGLPSWLNREGVRARDRFSAMCLKWYKLADQEFDWDNSKSHEGVPLDLEPVFGSQISRGLAQWSRSFGFSADSVGAVYALFLFGLHANTIPLCAWIMMELIKDPSLFQAVKREVCEAEITGSLVSEKLDYQKLASLPLLQSVYTEALRLHVDVLITRTSTEPVTIAGYTLPKGSVVQAPTGVAHLDEFTWGTQDHPASEFWGYRHIKEIEIKDDVGHITKQLSFSLASRTGSFFPYGGGISMCAGRNFAKPEVLLAVAMMVSEFDIEFVEWIEADGSLSPRAAVDDMRYANAVVTPPDRDMKIKWRKAW